MLLKKLSAIIAIFLFLICVLFPLSLSARRWSTLKTDKYMIFYEEPYSYRAWEILTYLETQGYLLEEQFDNSFERLPIIIKDVGMLTNGFADPIYHKITVFPHEPDSRSSISFGENWNRDVIIHEYVHMLHLTKAGGIDRLLVGLLGDAAAPNLFSPSWVIEGIPTYHESSVSPHAGRLNDGRFDAILAAKAVSGNLPSLEKATHHPLEFPGYESSYLYGAEFINYLSERYGYEKINSVIERYSSSIMSYLSPLLPPLGMDSMYKEEFGRDTSQLWEDWQRETEKKYYDFSIDGVRFTYHGWYVDNLLFRDSKLYFTRRYPRKTDVYDVEWLYEIIEKDTANAEEKVLLREVTGFTSNLKLRGKYLYYSLLDVKKGYGINSELGYGYIARLFRMDLESGKTEFIFSREFRGYDIAGDGKIYFSDDRRDSYGSIIYTYDPETGETVECHRLHYLIDEFLIKDGNIIALAKPEWENYSIYSINMGSGTVTPVVRSLYQEAGLDIIGDSIFFSSNYKGSHHCYMFNMQNGKLYRLTDGGFGMYPAYDKANGMLYFTGVHDGGYDVYRKALAPESAIQNETSEPIYTKDLPGSKIDERRRIEFDPVPAYIPPVKGSIKTKVETGGYLDNLKMLIPSFFPKAMVLMDDDLLFGFGFREQDALGENYYQIGAFYDWDDKKLKYSFRFETLTFAPFMLDFFYENIDEEEFGVDAYYPVYRSLSSGVSNIYLGSQIRFFDDYNRYEFSPSLIVNLKYPGISGFGRASVPIESIVGGSEENRAGLYFDTGWKIPFEESHFYLYSLAIFDSEYPGKTFDEIRGYDKPPPGKSGLKMTFEYTWIWAKFRKGIWSPNIFIEDLSCTVFVDALSAEDSELQLSTGIELHAETRLFFQVPLDIGIRLAVTKTGDAEFSFLVYLPLTL